MARVVSTFAAHSESRSPLIPYYAASILDCGHRGSCELKPTILACSQCGHQQTTAERCEACGALGKGFKFAFFPDPLRPEDRLTQVGDKQECETCGNHAAAIERLRQLDEPVAYARYSERWGGQYKLYRRDPKSPSGVMLIASFPAIPEIDRLLDQKRIAAISPTEYRR